MSQQAGQRRRGAELEDTILEAAWAELHEVGYARLTMEGVAARAQTGKQVLYRRWRNRAELALAALRRRTGSIADQPPDTGTLRGDVVEVLRRMARRQHDVPLDLLHGLMAESADIQVDVASIMTDVMTGILERAAARGEIASAEVSPRVLSAPANLLRHELILTRHPITEKMIAEIVDEVFLPLVQNGS
ncbi:DNA-binding transcriptional regulator, AcrR family [Nonomuraea solani]|uniref:DNA-binding transcriptional regulator, AcrR family n=1 Tax=Nonomuraea solani TaxID=1144553 RepID=A0A1H6EVB3_9ACTN|nr:TetR/AcrR family transcriptional regulator [Nonomuraea solani]SEH01323.1 DNA-binding transcriptional regulator, AcrR family [Nonomuraea solani]